MSAPLRSSALAATAVLLGACRASPPARWVVGEPDPIEADHVFGADLDGDGRAELGTVRDGTLHLGDLQTPLPGEFQRAAALPRGSGEVALVAVGQGRGQTEAPVRVLAVDATEATTLWERAGERDQVTDLRTVDGRVWLAVYADGRSVSGGWLDDGTFTPLTQEHMGQRQVPLPDGSVVVGRVYGTKPKSPGDLRRLPPAGGAPEALASLRGVRAMALADLDADGHVDLVTGDGWHYAYGREGDARIVLHRGPDFTDHRVIGWVPDSYAALDIFPIGTGREAALVVQGSHRVVLLARDELGWGVSDLGPVSEVGSVAVLSDGDGVRVAVGGADARVLPLRRERP